MQFRCLVVQFNAVLLRLFFFQIQLRNPRLSGQDASFSLGDLIIAADNFRAGRFNPHPPVLQLALDRGDLLADRVLLFIDLAQLNFQFGQLAMAALLVLAWAQ